MVLAQVRPALLPEKEVVTLQGTISVVHTYGPPGYGEDKAKDSHVTILVLRLKNPINVHCESTGDAEDCKPTKELRMLFEGPNGHELEQKARGMAKHESTVKGILRRRITAGEYTPIVVSVDSIAPVPSPGH
jgi:hypothetical protein